MSAKYKMSLLVGIFLLLLAPAAQAQEDDRPSVWLLAFGDNGETRAIVTGMLDALEAYGFINPEDRSKHRGVQMIDSAENSAIRFNRSFASYEMDRVREVVADALDHEPDVLVTITAPLTQAALHATQDLDDPPAIFFAGVYNPYEAGIADAPCIKPDHVIGSESTVDYERVMSLLLLQNPDMKTVGTIHNSSDASGIYGAGQIAELGDSLGLTVEQSAVVFPADLALAADGLISKGVEAILLPMDYTTTAGLPLITNIANDQGIPVFYASIDGLFRGAAIGAGFDQWFTQGNNIGAMLAAWLNGELDLASSGISALTGEMTVGVSLLDESISIPEPLREQADLFFVMHEGEHVFNVVSERARAEAMRIYYSEPDPLEARAESDRAFLAGLECTAERIAEQQAELDAMDG